MISFTWKPRISQTTKVKLSMAEWIEGNVDNRKREQGFLQGYRYALKLTATVQLCKCQNPLNYIHLIEIAINLKILPSSSPIFLGIDHKNILWPTLQMIGFSVPYPAIFSRKGHRDQKEVEKHFLFLPFLSAITSHPSVQSYFYSHPGFIKPQHKNRPIHPPFWVFSLKALMSDRVKPGSICPTLLC